MQKRGSSRVYIVSNDNRIHAESGEPADEVIGRLDVDTFLQVWGGGRCEGLGLIGVGGKGGAGEEVAG